MYSNHVSLGNAEREALKNLKFLVSENPYQVWFHASEFAHNSSKTCTGLIRLGYIEKDTSKQLIRYKLTPSFYEIEEDEI
jgi:hypothetical protein